MQNKKPNYIGNIKFMPYIGRNFGGPVAQKLEPLIEMFRIDENMLIYAEKFAKYCRENFNVNELKIYKY